MLVIRMQENMIVIFVNSMPCVRNSFLQKNNDLCYLTLQIYNKSSYFLTKSIFFYVKINTSGM